MASEYEKIDIELRKLRNQKFDNEKEVRELFGEKISILDQIGNYKKDIPKLAEQVKELQGQILTANGKLKDTQRKTDEEIAKSKGEQAINEGILAKIEKESKGLDAKKTQDLEADKQRKIKEDKLVSGSAKLDQERAAFEDSKKEYAKKEREIEAIKQKETEALAGIEKKSVAAEETLNKAKEVKARTEDKETAADKKTQELNLRASTLVIDKKSNEDEKANIEKQKKDLVGKLAEAESKSNTYDRMIADLNKKKDEFEVRRLRVEKIIKEKGVKEELAQLEKELKA